MNRLDCAGRASAISLLTAFAIFLGAGAADARHVSHRHSAVKPTPSRHVAAIPVPMPRPVMTATAAPSIEDTGVVLSNPTLSIVADDQIASTDTPTIIRPSRKVYCVEFARLASGIALFGDAKTWWGQANSSYAQIVNPAPGAVMVFAGRKTMRSGHVAVVKRVMSSRKVLVDHANWGRDGSIYLNAPVVDVSPNNDWSQVRVWNTKSNTLGTTAYSLKGFIAQRQTVN